MGLPTAQVLAREELFSGWRLFFERLSEHLPVVMVVEDLQWADAGMVDFIDHLLEWSGDHALFLLVLTRPEGTDRRGLGTQPAEPHDLFPRPAPERGHRRAARRARPELRRRPCTHRRAGRGYPALCGRDRPSLLDKGVLAKRPDGALHLVGELGNLEIPPGLTALIASRLDALSPDERRVVKECSVLGESFSRQAVEAVSEIDRSAIDEILTSLVRKEVLTVRADKLSPERGQSPLPSRSSGRSPTTCCRGPSARPVTSGGGAPRAAFPDEGAEVSEVIAAHLHDAYKAAGDDADAEQLRSSAKEAHVLAGERAESVGAPEGGRGHVPHRRRAEP